MDNYQDRLNVLFEALLSGDPYGAIERGEKRGQSEFVSSERLPIRVNDGANTDSKIQYEKMGIKVVDKYDDLFYNVILPDGWKKEATGHSMWNNLLDNKDRVRATIFYKAAFYDRDAFINFERRFTTDCVLAEDAPSELSWSEKQLLPHYGVIKDCGRVIAGTAERSAKNDREAYDIHNQMRDVATKRLKEMWPDFEDVNAYWDW